jgi:hypothetical protein
MNCAANVPKELQTSPDKRLQATVQLFEAANRVHNVINELQLCVNALEDTHSTCWAIGIDMRAVLMAVDGWIWTIIDGYESG